MLFGNCPTNVSCVAHEENAHEKDKREDCHDKPRLLVLFHKEVHTSVADSTSKKADKAEEYGIINLRKSANKSKSEDPGGAAHARC